MCELLNEVLYDLVLQGVSEIQQVRVDNYIYSVKIELSTLACHIFVTLVHSGLEMGLNFLKSNARNLYRV